MPSERTRTLIALLLAAPLAGCSDTAAGQMPAPGELPAIADVLAQAQAALGAPGVAQIARPGAPRVAQAGRLAAHPILTQSVTATGQRFDPGQVFRLGDPPLFIQDFQYTRTRDLTGGRVRTAWQRAGGYPTLFPFAYDEIVGPTNGYFTSPHNFEEFLTFQAMPAMTSGSVDATQRNRELDEPQVLIAEAIAHPDHVTDFKARRIDGRRAFELSLRRPFTPTRVAIDAETFLPLQTAHFEDDAVQGDSEITVRFPRWTTVDGVKLPAEIVRSLNGAVIQRDERGPYQLALGPDTGTFDVPADSTVPYDPVAALIGDQHPDLYDRGNSVGLLEGDPVTAVNVTEIAPSIFIVIGSTHHSLAIGTDHGVVVVEAPNDESRSLAVMNALAQIFPGKPVQYVINTHHHHDHVGGLRTYVALGVPVVAPAADRDFLQGVFAAPHTVIPDMLARAPRRAQLIGVDETGWSFTDGRTIQAMLLTSDHVDHQLVVYVPDAGVVFQSDLYYPHLLPPEQQPAPFKATTHALYQELVLDRGLDVQLVAAGHAGVATADDFRIAAGF